MKSNKFNQFTLAKYSRIIIFLGICIALSVSSQNFLTWDNIINMLRQSSLLAILALGMTFAMLTGKGVDLSIGSVLAFTSCLVSPMLKEGSSELSIIAGIIIALILGIVIGAVNGILITYVKIPAFLVTFGMSQVIRGLVYMIMSGTVVSGFARGVTFLGAGYIFGIPTPIVIAVLIALVTILVLKRTPIGREIYIIGANEMTAKFSGIKVDRTVIFGFICSNFLAALAGIVFIARLGTAEPQIGEAFAFQAIAAAAIGGTSFDGGVGHPLGTVLGTIILTLLINGMNLLNISSFWQGTVNGLMIILAVVLDQLFRKRVTQ